MAGRPLAVLGATGYTGQFVVRNRRSFLQNTPK
jgi:hypothetical protein